LNKLDGGFFSPNDRKRYHDVFNCLVNYGDHYLLLADYSDYISAQSKVDELYLTPAEWHRKAILNVAGMGSFSSDRTIRDYAIDTWNMGSLLKKA
jgi:starch phosphorylase